MLGALKDGTNALPVTVVVHGLSETELTDVSVEYRSLWGNVRQFPQQKAPHIWKIQQAYISGISITISEQQVGKLSSVSVGIGDDELAYNAREFLTQWQRENAAFLFPRSFVERSRIVPGLLRTINWKGYANFLRANFLRPIFICIAGILLLHVKRLSIWWGTLFILAFCLGNLGFIAAIFRRGFFFHTDGGLIMMLFEGSCPNDVITAAFTIIPRLFFWFSPDPIVYRAIRFVINIGLGGLVYFTFWRWMRTLPSHLQLHPAELAAGAGLELVGASSYPMLIQAFPLGHHDLLQWAAMLTVCLFLRLLTSVQLKHIALCGLGAGFVGGWTFFVKAPTPIFLSGAFLAGCWLIRPSDVSYLIRLLVGFCAGVALAAIGFFSAIQTPAQWFESLKIGLFRLQLMGAASHTGISAEISRYWQQVVDVIGMFVRSYGLLVLISFLLLYSAKRFFFHARFGASDTIDSRPIFTLRIDTGQCIAGILAAIPVSAMVYYLITVKGKTTGWPDFFALRTAYPMLVLLILAGVMTVAASLRGRGRRSWSACMNWVGKWKTSLVVMGMLLFMPVAVGIASNQMLIRYMREGLWAWILTLLLLAARTRSKICTALRWWIFFVLPCCLMIGQQVYAVKLLYGTFDNIGAHRYTATGLPKGHGLLFPLKEAEYYRKAYNILTEKSDYVPGDYILGLYELPNLTYMLGAKSPGTGAYYTGSFGTTYNSKLMERLAGEEISEAFIITNQSIDKELLDVIRKKGALFPDTYEKIGELSEYKTGNIVSIHAPRHRLRQ